MIVELVCLCMVKKPRFFTLALSYAAGRWEYFLEIENGCNKQGNIDEANHDGFHQICRSCIYCLIYQNSMMFPFP